MIKLTQISLNERKIIDQKISNLVKDNKILQKKNDEIIPQNQKLIARLVKLEKIKFKVQSSSDIIPFTTKEWFNVKNTNIFSDKMAIKIIF